MVQLECADVTESELDLFVQEKAVAHIVEALVVEFAAVELHDQVAEYEDEFAAAEKGGYL